MQRILQEIIKNNNNWNIRRLVNESFVPVNQRTSVVYCRLSDLWSCHYATGCFVAFLGDISTLKLGWNMKKIFCCPALPPLFRCLPLWKTVRLHRKKLQNATNVNLNDSRILNILGLFFSRRCTMGISPFWSRIWIFESSSFWSLGEYNMELSRQCPVLELAILYVIYGKMNLPLHIMPARQAFQ